MTLEDTLLDLEARVLQQAGGDLFAAVAELRLILAGRPGNAARILAHLAISDFDGLLQAGVRDAYQAGVNDAVDGLRGVGTVSADVAVAGFEGAPAARLVGDVAGLAASTRAAVEGSKTMLRIGAAPEVALGPVFEAANRVRNVVTSTVVEAGNSAVRDVAAAAGERLVWQAERDACVYCLSLAGSVVVPGDVFPAADRYAPQPSGYGVVQQPPRHPNCLPGDAVVTPGSRVTGATTRIYKGQMVRIRTLLGHELSVTPNHPVLTDRGWIPAGRLCPGDRVLSRRNGEGKLVRDGDGEYMPASISEVTESVFSSSEVTAREVPTSAVDFHGDGTDGEVAHVAADLHLPTEHLTLCDEHVRELLLVSAVDGAAGGSSGSATDGGVFGSGHTAYGVVSGDGKSLPLFWGRIRHAIEHRGGTVAWLDAAFEQVSADDVSADVEAVGDALLALAGEVVADELVSVEMYAFHGPVYNIETQTGWYTGNGIIVHNCRCTVAVLVDESYAVALRREADRSILRGFSLQSESNALRVRAAAKVLDDGVVAPKSVVAYARRAVRDGKFPRGRDVPAGGPRLVG